MKKMDINEAVKPLAAYARQARQGPLIVTRRGKPLAAVVSLEGMDAESLAVSTDPGFLALLKRSRAAFKKKGGISVEEMRKRLGIDRRAAG